MPSGFSSGKEKRCVKPNHVEPSFPKRDIGLLQRIRAIGTKLLSAETIGTHGKKI